MLLELRIENLLLIERAELRLGPGLNAITGETGAGKTVLAHSLDLLMGGRARAQIVRPGAAEAYVEGVFELPDGLLADPELEELAERLPEGAEELVLARRVSAGGRTSAYVQGRSANVADLRALGSRLLAFYGQHEHRRLTLASAQLDVLDGFAGPDASRAARALPRGPRRGARRGARARGAARAGGHARARSRPDALRARGDRGRRSGPRRARRARRRARAAAPRRGAPARGGRGALRRAAGSDDEGGRARGPGRGRGRAGRRRPGSTSASTRSPSASRRPRSSCPTSASELRSYADGVEAEPGRLEAVEERLDAIERLERKHGGTIEAVLAHAERCRAEIERLGGRGGAGRGARGAARAAAGARGRGWRRR